MQLTLEAIVKKVATVWLDARFMTAKTASLKMTMLRVTPIRKSGIQSHTMTDMTSKPEAGSHGHFYMSTGRLIPARN